MLRDRPVYVHVTAIGLTANIGDGRGNTTTGARADGLDLHRADDVRALVAARFANDQDEHADAAARDVVRISAFTWLLPPLDTADHDATVTRQLDAARARLESRRARAGLAAERAARRASRTPVTA